MNILAVYGSPRAQENSTQLFNAFLDEAKSNGVTVRSYHLNTLTLNALPSLLQLPHAW